MVINKIWGAICIAYALACAAVVVMYQIAAGNPFTPEVVASGMALTLAMSLPGFVVLRLGLWAAGVSALPAFAVAGGINSAVALTLFFRRPTADLGFVAMGLVAGAVYLVAEKAVLGRVLVRRTRVVAK